MTPADRRLELETVLTKWEAAQLVPLNPGITFVACRAQVISADTQPMSLKTRLLLMSALQDRFLKMLETTWCSSSLSEDSWATRAWRQLFLEHSVA